MSEKGSQSEFVLNKSFESQELGHKHKCQTKWRRKRNATSEMWNGSESFENVYVNKNMTYFCTKHVITAPL